MDVTPLPYICLGLMIQPLLETHPNNVTDWEQITKPDPVEILLREKWNDQGRRLRGDRGDRPPPEIIRWRGRRCFYPPIFRNVIASCHRKRE